MDNKTIEAVLADPVNGRLALSASLGNFIKFFHWYLYHQEFVMKDFHLLVIRKIEDIAFGRASKRNLAITIAPRLGKSSICKYACAWSYMLNPASNCIYTSYSDDLASDFSKEIREIVESEAFRRLTGLGFKKGKTGADYWVTTGGGGFRAAPLAGGLTGYGFGVSGEEFGGFGICFPYEEVVWTDKGKLKIGDIVEKKIDCKVLSYNFQEGGFEYQPIDGYVENGESSTLKIVFDGGDVECTPEHYFWTENGYKRACDLTVNDGVMIAPDSFDLSDSNIKFGGNIFSRVVFIKDKIKLLFRKLPCFNGAHNIFGKSFKGCPSFDIGNGRSTNPVSFSDNNVRSGVGSDVDNILGGELGTGKNKGSMSGCVSHIIGFGSIGDIFNVIIKRISVQVANFYTFFLDAYKRMSNGLMNIDPFSFRVFGTHNKKVSSSVLIKFKHFFGNMVWWLRRGGFNHSSDRFNSSFRADFITPLKPSYRKPLLISKGAHIHKSYCLTIRNNHNMVVGKSQGFLAKNCDDPNKPSLVKSQTELQNTIDLYENAFRSRANNRAKSPILMIMQRVAVDDLVGYVLENESEDWDLVKVPALDEETGKSVWEEKLPAAELLKLKKQNPFVYYSQYQQEPIVIGGSVIKTEWFRYYNTADTFTYQCSWFTADTAQKKGEANDFTVFQYWAKTYDNRLHLIDMVRGKFDAPELREQIIMFWEKWKKGINGCVPYGFYIEDKSSGIGAIQEIRKTYPLPIIPITRARYKDGNMIVKQDKFSRVMTIVPYIANGWVYLPNSEKDDMSSLLLAEAAAFRADLGHKHDDQIDCLADAVDIAFGATGISSIFI